MVLECVKHISINVWPKKVAIMLPVALTAHHTLTLMLCVGT